VSGVIENGDFLFSLLSATISLESSYTSRYYYNVMCSPALAFHGQRNR